MLLQLGVAASSFVSWLSSEEPLVRAYTACILANIAFLEAGQQQVLNAGGVPPLLQMLKSGEEKKVTLHATAAVQNLTYKNTACCHAVLESGGEKALKKLLQHKSEDVQQFAAGALANLQLYRRVAEEPGPNGKKGGINRKVKQILRRRAKNEGGGDGDGGDGDGGDEDHSAEVAAAAAATAVQAAWRGHVARKECARQRRKAAKKGGNRYGGFSVSEVRSEVDRNEMLPPLAAQMKKPHAGAIGGSGSGMGGGTGGGMGGGGGAGLGGHGFSVVAEGARRPTRLAPLEARPALPTAAALPPLAPPRLPPNLAAMPRMGQAPAVR